MIATPYKTPRFYTSVGAASTGVLLAFGIRNLIGAIKEPLTTGLVGVVNVLIKWQHWQIFPLRVNAILWSLQIGRFVAGLLIIALAIKIAFWLTKKRIAKSQ